MKIQETICLIIETNIKAVGYGGLARVVNKKPPPKRGLSLIQEIVNGIHYTFTKLNQSS